jgi:hypothetical protein
VPGCFKISEEGRIPAEMYVMEIEGCELSKRNFPEEEVDLD